ncbi:2068_t:CDS:10 [Ambispora gerdemannii]|uniref:2068_t:CDS:1 n=1 Tax=Ambispora gerdemannii TaxID=144530 RepID=A0A9N8WDS7_9GLOM|nr:2068_t:CDS:10 [Ambispora gerdemannii]
MSTEISFSSYETLVKALKSNTLSSNEKIKIAKSIWKGKQECEIDVFPHKEVFLAEWVSSSLVKSVGGKTGGEQQQQPGFGETRLISPAYLNKEYWILMQDILEFITRKWQTVVIREIDYIDSYESSCTMLKNCLEDYVRSSSPSPSFVDSENTTNTIRTIRILASSFNKIPITIAFSAVVNSIASSLDNAKRILDSNDISIISTKTTATLDIFEQSSSLLRIVVQCFGYFTTPFSINSLNITMYRPTLDHLTTLGLNTCNLYRSLVLFVNRSFDDEENNSLLSSKFISSRKLIIEFSSIVLRSLEKVLLAIPNPKKEKSFIRDEDNNKNKDDSEFILDKTLEHIDRIIRFGLFQQEHLLEYVSCERDESWKLSSENMSDKSNETEKAPIAPGYQKLLFDRIQNMMRNSSTDHAELSNSVVALLNQMISLPISGKEQMAILQIALETQNQLLSLLLHYNVYRPSNDEISLRQFAFLQNFMDRLMSFASLYFKEGKIQSSIFKTINYAIQLDHRVVDPQMEKLCEYLLLPSLDGDSECRSLIITIIEIYAKSREMERFLQCIFNGLKTINADVDTLLRKPLYCRECLSQFSNNATMHVSIAQAHEIINVFINELISTYSSGLKGDKTATASHQKSSPRKRRKINAENEHLSSINDNNNTADPQIFSPEPLIMLFIQFLKALKSATAPQFNERLKEPLQKLFNGFISSVLLSPSLSRSFGTIHETFLDRIVAPTLFLHCSLVDLFSVAYLEIYSAMNFVDGLLETLSNVKIPKVKLIMNKSILQHIYLTSSNKLSGQNLQRIMNEENNSSNKISSRAFITTVLDTLLNNSEDTANLHFSWTGRLIDLTKDNFMIANSKLVINDWLDVNSQGSINPQEVNLHSICVELSRSAQFFEISCIRDVFIKTFFEELFGFIKQQIKDKKQPSITDLLDSLSRTMTHQVIVISPKFWKSSLPFFKSDLTIPLAESSLFPITKVSAYFHTLLIFPIEYFEKREKDAILAVVFIVEKLGLSLFRVRNLADVKDLLEFSLVCRSLTSRIVKIENRESVLRHHGEFIEWWMTSITSYSRQINEARQNSDEFDDGNIVTSLYSNLVQITGEVLYTTIYQVLNRSRDKDCPFNNEYWNGVISTFKTLSKISLSPIDQFSSWINSVNEKELENNIDLRFLGDFLKACMDYFEKSSNNSRLTRMHDHEQKIWDSFAGLCVSVEQDLLRILELWVNSTTNNLKNDDRYHRISSALAIKNNNNSDSSACDILRILPRFLVLPVPLLRIAIEPIHNNISSEKDSLLLAYSSFNSELVEIATTLLSLTLDFDLPVSDVSIPKIMALFWVMLKIVHDRVPIAEHLKLIFGNFIQKLSNEQYEAIVLCLWQKHDQLPYSLNDSIEQEITVFLVIVDLIFRESKQDQKKQLRKYFTQMLSGLCSIGQTTKSLNNRIRLLNVLASIATNKDFHLKGNDVSLVLSTSITIISSSLSSSANSKNIGTTKETTIKEMFDATCCLMHNLIRHNREQLASSFPSASSQKAFAKYVPFAIVEYLGAQVDGRFSPQIRDALKSGVYALLDMCGERERDLIMVACGKVGKELFKSLWNEYQSEWKYTGRG